MKKNYSRPQCHAFAMYTANILNSSDKDATKDVTIIGGDIDVGDFEYHGEL